MADNIDIPFDKLFLVRVQGGMDGDSIDPETGHLSLSREGSGRGKTLNSFHFTLNTVVQNHTMGKQFNGSEIAYVAPFLRAIEADSILPNSVSAGDTWFNVGSAGKMVLPDAQIIVPEDFIVDPNCEKWVTRYPRGLSSEETRLNRDNAIQNVFERNKAPLLELNGNSGVASIVWSGSTLAQSQAYFSRLVDTIAPHRDIGVNELHSNSVSHHNIKKFEDIDVCMESYLGGEKIDKGSDGIDRKIAKVLTDNITGLHAALSKYDNRSDQDEYAFFAEKYESLTDRYKGEVQPLIQDDIEAQFGHDMRVLDRESNEEQLMSMAAFSNAHKRGRLGARHTIYNSKGEHPANYDKLHPYAKAADLYTYECPSLPTQLYSVREYHVKTDSYHNVTLGYGDSEEAMGRAKQDSQAFNEPVRDLMKSGGVVYDRVVPTAIYAAGKGKHAGVEVGRCGRDNPHVGFLETYRSDPKSQQLFEATQERIKKFGPEGVIYVDPRTNDPKQTIDDQWKVIQAREQATPKQPSLPKLRQMGRSFSTLRTDTANAQPLTQPTPQTRKPGFGAAKLGR